MDCSKIHKVIGLYLSGGLSERGRRRFEEHIVLCVSCREEVRRYEKAYNLLDRVENITPAADFPRRLNARIRRAQSAPARKAGVLRRIPAWARGVAAVAACVAIAVALWFYFQPAPPVGLSAEEKEIVQNLDLLENLDVLEAAENGDIKAYSGKEFDTAVTLTGSGVDESDMDLAGTDSGQKP